MITMLQMQLANPYAVTNSTSSYLTPDALMSYCESRLKGIDSQVQAAFAQQQSDNQDSTTLSNLANAIQLPSGDLDLSKPADFLTAMHAAQAMDAAAASCQDPATKQALQTAAGNIYAKLNAVVQDREAGQTTFDQVNDSSTDAWATTVVSNSDGNHGGSISDDDKKFTLDEFKQDTTGAVQNIQQAVNSSAELSMINLQSLMSQRQEAIQVCTNLVQNLGDQLNKIADNVGK